MGSKKFQIFMSMLNQQLHVTRSKARPQNAQEKNGDVTKSKMKSVLVVYPLASRAHKTIPQTAYCVGRGKKDSQKTNK
jgi:hypothetical protein